MTVRTVLINMHESTGKYANKGYVTKLVPLELREDRPVSPRLCQYDHLLHIEAKLVCFNTSYINIHTLEVYICYYHT